MMEQTISDVETLTKTINISEGGGSDVEAGIQFIYHMREHSRVKAEAKRKFDVYPSAYANAWLVKTYKKRGGTYA